MLSFKDGLFTMEDNNATPFVVCSSIMPSGVPHYTSLHWQKEKPNGYSLKLQTRLDESPDINKNDPW